VRGLTECGVDVIDVGVVPTPLLYWALHHERVVGGIQITGSHNPPEYNGFKMCLGTASLHGEDIQTLYQYIVAGQHPTGQGTVQTAEVIDRYVHDIATRVGPIARADGSRIKVVYDCGNGAAALVAPQLFAALGLDAIGLFTESDGTFPNHHPDPTVPENLEDCIAAVRAHGAELQTEGRRQSHVGFVHRRPRQAAVQQVSAEEHGAAGPAQLHHVDGAQSRLAGGARRAAAHHMPHVMGAAHPLV
jgi:phosphomannomutase